MPTNPERQIEKASYASGDAVHQLDSGARRGLRTLYVENQGSIVDVKGGERFVIGLGGEILAEFSVSETNLIVLLGHCALTTLAIHLCLTREIPVVLLSAQGRYIGALQAVERPNSIPLRQQLRFFEDRESSLKIARELVMRKVSAQLNLLKLYGARKDIRIDDRELDPLRRIRGQIEAARALEEVRTLGGRARASYFPMFARLFNRDLGFQRRVHRSPTDPVNALLNLADTLLFFNAFTQVAAAGLSPYVGFFNGRGSRPAALAADLIEPLHAPVVEALTVFLVNTGIFLGDHFRIGATGRNTCALKLESIPRFFTYFESWVDGDLAESRELNDFNIRGVIATDVSRLRLQIVEQAGLR